MTHTTNTRSLTKKLTEFDSLFATGCIERTGICIDTQEAITIEYSYQTPADRLAENTKFTYFAIRFPISHPNAFTVDWHGEYTQTRFHDIDLRDMAEDAAYMAWCMVKRADRQKRSREVGRVVYRVSA